MNKNVNMMLYVNDVVAEKNFWEAVGFTIFDVVETMRYLSFSMKPTADSHTTFTVFDKKFIEQVSPEVANNVPSVLFETDDIETLQLKIASLTETTSAISEVLFKNFNFSSPSGIYFAVKG